MGKLLIERPSRKTTTTKTRKQKKLISKKRKKDNQLQIESSAQDKPKRQIKVKTTSNFESIYNYYIYV